MTFNEMVNTIITCREQGNFVIPFECKKVAVTADVTSLEKERMIHGFTICVYSCRNLIASRSFRRLSHVYKSTNGKGGHRAYGIGCNSPKSYSQLRSVLNISTTSLPEWLLPEKKGSF